jgi:hypothetical protein
MLGLNDHHIARRRPPDFGLYWQSIPGHGRGDGAYVLAQDPDYIILGASTGLGPRAPLRERSIADTDRNLRSEMANNAWFVSDHEIATSKDFELQYELRRMYVRYSMDGSDPKKGHRRHVFTYYRRR